MARPAPALATSVPRRPRADRWRCCEPGDIIEIDIPGRKLGVRLTPQELERRAKAWKAPEPRIKSGYLAKYAALATSADTGAVLKFS